MENRAPGPDQPESDDSDQQDQQRPVSKIRRILGNLDTRFQFLGAESDEDDDEESETTEGGQKRRRSRKFGAFLGKLFVNRESDPSDSSADRAERTPGLLSGILQVDRDTAHEPVVDEMVATSSSTERGVYDWQQDSELVSRLDIPEHTGVRVPEQDAPITAEVGDVSMPDVDSIQDTTEVASGIDASIPIETAAPAEQTSGANEDIVDYSVQYEDLSTPARHNRLQEQVEPVYTSMDTHRVTAPPSRVEQVVIEEKKSNALPITLVAAEYLARRRADRKLKEQINEASKVVGEQQAASLASTQRIEQKMTLQEIETARLQKAQADLEKKRQEAYKTEVSKIMPRMLENHQNVNNVAVEAKFPEVTADNVVHNKEVAKEVIIPKTAEVAEAGVGPELILQKTMEAADKNIAAERDYERRHEVKDEAGSMAQAQSVGSILNDTLPPAYTSIVDQLPPPVQPTQSSLSPIYSVPATQDYTGAAVKGAIAGVCMLVLIALIYIGTR